MWLLQFLQHIKHQTLMVNVEDWDQLLSKAESDILVKLKNKYEFENWCFFNIVLKLLRLERSFCIGRTRHL